jgi:hypothetical protein
MGQNTSKTLSGMFFSCCSLYVPYFKSYGLLKFSDTTSVAGLQALLRKGKG